MPKIEELKNKMICGDWVVIGKMLNITAKNAQQTFTRPDSKRYEAVLNAVEMVIENREKLLTNPKK